MTVTAGVVACSDDDDDESASGSSTTASASLGVVLNAAVNVFAADGTTLLGSGNTGETGTVQVDIDAYEGPVVIEILGGAGATYYDEAAGTETPFPEGNSMHALAPSADGVFGVTILTELAYQAAQQNDLLPISAAAVDELNEIVRAALAPGLSSILSVPTVFDSSTTSGSLTDTEAGRYALVLAALAQIGATSGAPALDVMNALVADLADGVIDSQDDGSPITTPYSDFINEMTTALQSMATSFGDSDLQANAADQAPASTNLDNSDVSNDDDDSGTGGGELVCNATPATLNTDLAGSYDLKYEEAQAGGPFTNGQSVTAVVGEDGSLQINGKTLSNPQYCVFDGAANTAEVIWADNDAQIEYALSDNNSGTFNEINVGDASQPRDFGDTQLPAFLGQLKEDTGGQGDGPANLALVTTYAGDYSVTEVKDGTHVRSSLSISAQGDIDYDADISFAQSDIDVIFDRLECCSRISVNMKERDGKTPRIDLFEDDAGNLVEVVYYTDNFGSSGSTVSVEPNM
ncbi:MAG: hypothetical protein R3352_04820 [Salinisphaeraceae bacterium]|nr:hypothetical protein [Salinisphaeraceae bacterium]